jgi:hypothetical protein
MARSACCLTNLMIYYGILFIGIVLLNVFTYYNYEIILTNDDIAVVSLFYMVFYIMIFICIMNIKYSIDQLKNLTIFKFKNDVKNLLNKDNSEQHNELISLNGENTQNSSSSEIYTYLREFKNIYYIKYRSEFIFMFTAGYIIGFIIAAIRFEYEVKLNYINTSHSKAYKIHLMFQNIFIVFLALINKIIVDHKVERIILVMINI